MATLARNAGHLGRGFAYGSRPLLQRSTNIQQLQVIDKRSLNIAVKAMRQWRNLSTPMKIGIAGSVTYVFFSDAIMNYFTPKGSMVKHGGFKGSSLEQMQWNYVLRYFPPEPKIYADEIVSPVDNTKLDLTLYQYKTCPFCCKVRAFLDYHGFSYKVVEVNSVSRKETSWSNYKKVPFLTFREAGSENIFQLKDSSMIISFLKSYIVNPSASATDLLQSYPIMDSIDDKGVITQKVVNQYNLIWGKQQDDKQIKHETEWRRWVDEVYVHYLSPNIYRTFSESQQAFQWFSKAGRWEELFSWFDRALVQCVGPAAMYLIGKKLKKKYNLDDDVRQTFYDGTNKWLTEIKKRGTKFMGGDRPDLSDLAAYGILTAIEGCTTFDDLMANTRIRPWYNAMTLAVKQHQGSDLLQNFKR